MKSNKTLTKLVGFIERLINGKVVRFYVLNDDRGSFYINREGERITVLPSEIV